MSGRMIGPLSPIRIGRTTARFSCHSAECSKCGTEFGMAATLYALKKALRLAGWGIVGGFVLCPACKTGEVGS